MFTFEELYSAYLECRKNKRSSKEALAFEYNQEENLFRLVAELNNRSYKPAVSVCFYIERPKPREIFAASFHDRIVHHLLYNKLAPVWEKIFIDQSFACRPGKGTHRAALVLQAYLRKITKSGKKLAYYLKMDIRNFFMSINKNILYSFLCKKCQNEELQWLLKVIIFHDPTTDYKMKSSEHVRVKLPWHKSLFHTTRNCGLPIGNLTSQFFANVYLNSLDQFVKHILKCRFYVRYADDFILLSEDKNQLLYWQQQIIQFINSRLLLEINSHATRIDRIFSGVDFAGFIIRPFYILCRRRVIGNCKAYLRKTKELLLIEKEDRHIWRYTNEITEKVLAILNSYLGHFRHSCTRKVIGKIFRDFSFLNEYFILNFDKIKRKYYYPGCSATLKKQVLYFTGIFAGDILLIQTGCYYETYNKAAGLLSVLLDYRITHKRRGFHRTCGFHMRYLDKVCLKLEQHRISYTVIKQTGKCLHAAMERIPYMRVQFIKT